MTRFVSVVLALTAVAATACSGSSSTPVIVGGVPTTPPVPAEFVAACGHPGASVEVQHVPVTIRHADCDLTGVTVNYKRRGGGVVSSKPGGVGNSQGFTMSVAKHTLDVTIDARGPVGNA